MNKCLLPKKDLAFVLQSTDRALVERYLLAATMKDCSLMISIKLVDLPAFATQGVQSCGQQIVRIVGPSGVGYISFAYSVKIVDLDPKSPKNLLNAYSRFMDGVKLMEQAPNVRRPCVSWNMNFLHPNHYKDGIASQYSLLFFCSIPIPIL